MTDLPPLDQAQAYVVVGPNDQRGPYTLDLLIGEVLAGRLHDATPVWWPGLAEWTTMSAHPGVAAELARRRAGYADPAAAAAPAAAPAPTPGQYEQYEGWQTSAPGQPTEPVSGQDYSADMFAGDAVPVEAAVDPTPAVEPVAAVSPVAEPVQAGETAPAEAVGETALMGEVVPAEVTGGESADVFSTGAAPAAAVVADAVVADDAGAVEEAVVVEESAPEVVAPDQVQPPAPSVDPAHQAAFDSLVERSRARTEGADRIAAADRAIVAAVVAAAESQGFRSADTGGGEDRHELRFDGQPGENLAVHVGRLTGDDPEALRADDLPLEVRYQSAGYGGELASEAGANGEVVVVADEWSGQATSTVWLRLPLADYLLGDLSVDSVALGRDVGATVAVVRSRLS